MPKRTRIHLTTLGCSKNTYDSEILLGQLGQHPVEMVADPEQADVVIINTCGFIDAAKKESVDAILEAEQLKKANPDKKVIVCGCLSQRYAQELRREIPSVDVYLGVEAFSEILSHLELKPPENRDHLYEQRLLTTPSHYAYLKISEGCNHKCAFCAIPLMRGRHRSRSLEAVVSEAERLAGQGVREIIIIAQDTTFYGLDLYGSQQLVTLLEHLEKIEGLEWIRLHYLYPTTVQDELIDYMAGSAKVVSYLDMPVQHISDHMLKVMKRGGSGKRIREIFDRARKRIDDVVLRTTFIVGHPGESEADFQELLQFIQEFRFDRVGVFKYSHEENTSAFRMADLSDSVKEERYQELMALQQSISLENNLAHLGKSLRVLIDEVDWSSLTAVARSHGDSPEIDNEVIIQNLSRPVKPGDFLPVIVTDASEYELYATIEERCHAST